MDKFFTKSLSFSLLLAPAMVLTVFHGLNISAIAILVLSIAVLICRYQFKIELNSREKILIFFVVTITFGHGFRCHFASHKLKIC